MLLSENKEQLHISSTRCDHCQTWHQTIFSAPQHEAYMLRTLYAITSPSLCPSHG